MLRKHSINVVESWKIISTASLHMLFICCIWGVRSWWCSISWALTCHTNRLRGWNIPAHVNTRCFNVYAVPILALGLIWVDTESLVSSELCTMRRLHLIIIGCIFIRWATSIIENLWQVIEFGKRIRIRKVTSFLNIDDIIDNGSLQTIETNM